MPEKSLQPEKAAMNAPAGDHREKELARAMARHQYSGDALIEVLHRAQELYGYLSPGLLKRIAHELKLPPSRVLGVATFYHLFRFQPAKKHTAVVCLGTACYAAGGSELMTAVEKRCARSGDWTIEAGRCVGSCGLAPVAICDGAPLSRVTPQELTRRVDRAEGGVQ